MSTLDYSRTGERLSPLPEPWAEQLQRRWSALRTLIGQTWSVAPVRRGVLASLLLALGSISPAFLPENSPWYDVVPYLDSAPLRAVATGLSLIGLVMMIDAWFQLRPRLGRPTVDMRVVVALWTIPMLLAPPMFSDDAYAYAAQGWLIHNGVNPYAEGGVSQLPGVWADQVIPIWRYTPAAYGPLALQANQVVVALFAFNPYWSAALGMRLLMVVSMAVVAACLPTLARRVGADPVIVMWFAIGNPVVVIHLIGGAHNEALMLAFLTLGLWMACRGRLLVGCALIAAAAAVKIPAIVGVVPVALLAIPPPTAERATRWQRQWHCAVVVAAATAVTVIAFVILLLACGLGWGWIQGLNVPGTVSTMAPTAVIGDFARLGLNELGYFDVARRVGRIIGQVGMIITVGAVIYLYFRHAYRRPADFLGLALLAITLGGPAFHPWYLAWSGTYLPLTQFHSRMMRISCWAVVIVLGSTFTLYAERNDQGAIALVGGLALLWVGWANDRLVRRGEFNNVTAAVAIPAKPPGQLLTR